MSTINIHNNIGGLPKGWEIAQLSDICERITKGSTPTSYGFAYTKSGVKFVKAENIDDKGFASTTTNYIDEKTNKYLSRSILKSNDLLFSIAGTIGRVGMVRGIDLPANTNQALAIIRHKLDFVDTKYLFYYLKSDAIQKEAIKRIVGVGRANLSLKEISDFKILLAPLDLQKKIVEEIETQFTRLDAGVAALKRAQANLKRYRAAVLKAACEGKLVPTEAELAKAEGRSYETGEQLLQRILAERKKKWEVEQKKAGGKKKYVEPKGPDVSSLPKLPKGWAWATVEQVTNKIQYGYTASANKHADGIRYLRITDIQNGNVNWESVPTCKIPKKSIADYILNEGDIVFARTGATVGKSFRLTGQFPESVFASYLIRVIPGSKYLSDWLNMYFQSPDYWKQIILSSIGVGQPNVNGSKLSILQMPVPPVAEQQRIVEEVERRLSVIDKQEENINEKQKMAGNLRNAILSQAFNEEK